MKEIIDEHRSRAHANKLKWHEEQANLPYSEKVKLLLQMQRDVLLILAARRPLKWWEKPWDIEP